MMKYGFLIATLATVAIAGQPQAPTDVDVLAKALTTPLKIARGEMPAFTITVDGQLTLSAGMKMPWQVTFVRADAERFGLSLRTMGQPMMELVRDTDETRLVAHVGQVAFVGKAPLAANLSLRLDALIAAIAEIEPKATMYLAMAKTGQPQSMAFLIQQFTKLQRVPGKAPTTFVAERGEDKGQITVTTTADGASIERVAWQDNKETNSVAIRITDTAALPQGIPDGLKVVAVARAELEHTVARAAVRGLEGGLYARKSSRPDDAARQSGAGSLTIDSGRRVVRLKGGPREIGRQHGALLPAETKRICESIVHPLGLSQSILRKVWYPDVLRAGLKQMAPHIPSEFHEEMAGLAEGAGLPLELVQMANVFPRLFGISGFVVLPEAAETKKLYHGHALSSGRWTAAARDTALFVVERDGAQPFLHVGTAGLIGVTAGMNKAKIVLSLAGEQDKAARGNIALGIGGEHEWRWDSTPSAFLIRMGLERGDTLEKTVATLRAGRRGGACSFLISDGAKNRAVLLRASKDSIDVHQPGEPHGVKHCLVAASPEGATPVAATLKKELGDMTSYKSRKLLRPPLSGETGLHSVLFMPQGHDVDIAIARGSSPAYKQRYKRYDLKDFLPKPKKPATPKKPTTPGKPTPPKEK
ncbi:hypothetical protein HQ560_19805 [bacterium]|nr:hypothetical protein [bacterium]